MSWIMVATGPEPNAGSNPRRDSSHGKNRPMLVAAPPAARTASATAAARRRSPKPNQRQGEGPETRPDHQPGAELAGDQSPQRIVVERQPAHGPRLALRADGIGQVDDTRHEEGDRKLRGERPLEARHDEGRGRAAGEPHEQPGQAVARPCERRGLESVRGSCLVLADADQAMHVLDVLAAQDLDQRLGRDDAEQSPGGIHYRHGRDARGSRGSRPVPGLRRATPAARRGP